MALSAQEGEKLIFTKFNRIDSYNDEELWKGANF